MTTLAGHSTRSRGRAIARRAVRAFGWTAAGLVVLAVVLLAAGWLTLRASLPVTSGEVEIAGLDGAVVVERDELGIPTIRATSRTDAARALGFLHAQERLFQMDLLRRQPAGELAELFGAAALPSDRILRVHRFRERARRALAASPPEHRAILEAYAAGVNAGMDELGARPFEYLLLRAEPEPWRPEDSFLAIYAMYLDLQDEDGSGDSSYGVLRDTMPAEMFAFLAPHGTEWDAPLDGSQLALPPIPGPEVFDLRREPVVAIATHAAKSDEPRSIIVGSNSFAVSARASAAGRAMVANDMHLGIAVPIIWYRASMRWRDREGTPRRVTGVTLPGTPLLVVGSNGSVAWAFTNSYGDWADLILVDEQTPRVVIRETIRVKGGDDEVVEVEETIWGPIVDRDHEGRPRSLRWVAHEIRGANMNMIGLERAATVEEAMAVANGVGIPAQNFVVGDSSGRIAWTIAGAIPHRPAGVDGRLPMPPEGAWTDWLDPSEYPRIVDPPEGRIWTANARVVGGAMRDAIGDGGYALGARARQIRDDLRATDAASEADLLAIQLDDRAVFLARWQELLLSVLSPEAIAADPRRGELRRLVDAWGARASVDSAGYRMVRAYRTFLEEELFEALTSRAATADSRFRWRDLGQREHALWALASQRPPHLLPPNHATWDEQLLATADRVIEHFTEGERTLASRTWGERNTSAFRHPLAGAVPFFGRYLEYPRRRLPGDSYMPRVQAPTEGASQRMVVSPGREDEGIFHLPGGQTGHPLSPHFADGHLAWVEGRGTPFLPGETVERLRLVPREKE
ncbi:MAG: penicillin acylase family protein [Thermoanaerobaculia bacterium]